MAERRRPASYDAPVSDLLAAIVPAGWAVVEVQDDAAVGGLVLGDAALGPAAPGRLAEFARGRGCAHAALAGLGLDGAIGRGDDRAPRWPAGVVGSITHCAGYVAAAVARAAQFAAVGIDAEPAAPLPADVLAQVASAAERDLLAALPPGRPWDRLLFSIKESVFKAWWPATGRWLDFDEATVTIAPGGTWTARLSAPGPWPRLAGRYAMDDAVVVAAAWVTAGAA